MTSPGGTGFQIGRGYLELVADDRGLRREVSEAARKAGAGQHVDVQVRVDDRGLWRDLDGRLRDARGRFAAAGTAAGGSFSKSLSAAMGGSFRKAFKGFGGDLGFTPIPPQLLAITAAAIPAAAAVGGLVASLGMAAASSAAILPMLMGLGAVVGVVAGSFAGLKDRTDPMAMSLKSVLKGFTSDLKELQRVASDNFLPGVVSFLQDAQTLLPRLTVHVRELAGNLGFAASEVGALMRTDLFTSQLDTVMSRNTRAFGSLSEAAAPLVGVFMSIAASASQLVPRLAEATENSIHTLSAWVEMRRVSGELDAFFQRAGDNMAMWGRIVWDLLTGIVNILRAALPAGEQLAGGLETIAQRFADWTGSTEGQSRMRGFFEFILNIDYGKILQVASAVATMALAINALSLAKGAGGIVAGLASLQPAGLAILGVAVAITAAAGAMAYLYRESQPVRDTLDSIGNSFMANVIPPLREFGGFIMDEVVPALRDGFIWYLREVGTILTQHVFPALREAMSTILPALEKAWTTVTNAFKDNRDELLQVWGVIKTVAGFIWDYFVPVLAQVVAFLIGAFAGSISATVNTIGFLVDAVNWVIDAFKWLGELAASVWAAVVSAVTTAAAWISSVMQSIISAVVGAFQWIYSVVSSVMSAIWSAIMFALDIVKQLFVIAFNFINDNTGGALTKMYNAVVSILGSIWAFITGAMNMIITGWQIAWDWVVNIVSGAWNWISSKTSEAAGWVSGKISSFTGAVVGIFNSLGGSIRSAWGAIWSWVSDTVSTWSNRISDIIGSIKDRAIATFRAIPGAIVGSINTLLRLIQGMIDMVNKILPGSVQIKPIWNGTGITMPQGYATGGPIRGAGTGTSDSIPIMASDGEFMLRARSARGLADDFGPGFLDWLNHYDLRSGDRDSAILGPRRYADGGLISSTQSWIRAQDPLPYVLGSNGPGAWDCSSLVGGVWALLTGQNPNRRYFTTYNLPGAGGFVPGHGTYTIGLSREHVVGNLGGLAFEAANPGDGILVGAGATSVDRMPAQYYLPQMGNAFIPSGSGVEGFSFGAMVGRILDEIVSPIRRSLPQPGGMFNNIVTGVFDAAVGGLRKRKFDGGGLLMPGPTLVDNGTGRPETVRTFEQEAALSAGGTTFNVTMNIDPTKLKTVADIVDLFENLQTAARQYSK